MPRPKSDIRAVSVRLPEADLDLYGEVADIISGDMDRSKVIRALVEAARLTPAARRRFAQIVLGPGYRQPPVTQKLQYRYEDFDESIDLAEMLRLR